MMRIRVAACLTKDDRILLVEHAKKDRRYWLLPGGGLEEGETLHDAVKRELMEETGLAIEVGRLIIVCEVIEPAGRHIVNLVFAGQVTGGKLAVGADRYLVDARWRERDELSTLESYPRIAQDILACWDENFTGPVRYLGDVWQPKPES